MIQHAAAMVAWKAFRSGRSGGAPAYDYGSNQRRLLERVDGGGTLWLVTSSRRARESRKYHLAYKLTDCAAIDPKASTLAKGYDYVVRAGDWRASRHFAFNDATSALRRLQFTSGKPMAEVTNFGLRLLSIPALTSGDVAVLERLQHRIEHGRNVFLSYSRKDATIASTIEAELGNRDVSVSRDVMLLPGQRWEDALRKEVTGTDCFVVLVSPNSAADNSFVRREVDWALAEYDAGGFVTKILPIVLPGAAGRTCQSSTPSSGGTIRREPRGQRPSIFWPKGSRLGTRRAGTRPDRRGRADEVGVFCPECWSREFSDA